MSSFNDVRLILKLDLRVVTIARLSQPCNSSRARHDTPASGRLEGMDRPEESPGDCYSCRQEKAGEGAPLRERIWRTDHWRVVHSFNSALEGWLVALPRRHVTALAALDSQETAELGHLLRRTSAALGAVLGCQKTYVVEFSEAPGFHHLHFHVVARPRDLEDALKGPRVFDYLRRPASEWVTPERQDELAAQLAAEMAR